MQKIWVLHGPNTNLMGQGLYAAEPSLLELNRKLSQLANSQGFIVECQQSNHEGAMLDSLQQSLHARVDFLVINPSTLAHTSLALRETLQVIKIPFIEVQLHNSPHKMAHYLRDIALGSIVGLGSIGYELALAAAIAHLQTQHNPKKQMQGT